MRKLYLKIVVAIWVVMIMTAVGAVLLVSGVVPEDPYAERSARRPFDRMAEMIAQSASEHSLGRGEQGLVEWFENNPLGRRIARLELIDQFGVVLVGRGNIRDVASESRTSEAIFVHDGRSYTLTTLPPTRPEFSRAYDMRRTVGTLIRHPGYRWLLLSFAVALSIGLSVVLARYLVRPLSAFEAAGRKLASGDLKVRVASELGNRSDEIADFAATFDRMAGRIETLVQSHKELLRDVSHELRSPLARAHAALSLARQQTDGAVDAELDRIEYEFERLDAMIGKLLVWSRIDTKQIQFRMEKIDLYDFLQGLISDAQIEADVDNKSVVLVGGESIAVLADAELLSSSFENILRNAVRYTPVFNRVDVTVQQEADDCVVTIRDHGAGVNDADLEKIFLPFYKSDDGHSADFSGSGIGLAIACQAIKVHGGDVVASNADGGGLLVRVTLPICKSG